MKALTDVKILDLSQKLTVNLATMYLEGYGAEVVKVEMPNGDAARSWQPIRKNESLYFNYLNGGKKSVVIDYRTEEGMAVLKDLIPMFDVVCLDFTAAEQEKLGLTYEDVKAVKEDVIYAAYSYYGSTGPMKNRPGSSITVQARAVAMNMTGVRDDYPVQAAPSIGEHYSAAYLATGIVMALQDKLKRGIGQKVDIALLDSIYSCIEAAPAAYSSVGEVHKRKGNFDPSCAPYDTFETSDGYVAIGVATQAQWEKFCEAMDLQDLAADERFKDNEGRRTDYLDVLRPLLAKDLIGYTKTEIENKCRKLGIPCCAVLTIPEITDLPFTLENGYMTAYDSEKFGKLKYPTIPFALSETPAEAFADAPELGADTADYLRKTGRA